MSPQFGFDFYFGGLAVLTAGALIFMAALTQGISYQCRSPKNLLVFRPPLGLRLWMIMLVLWLIACILLQVINKVDVVGNLFVLLPVAIVAGGFIVLVASRRPELRLDLEQHTYRFTDTNLFRSRVHLGPWKDFTGVFVRISRTESGDICHVGLAWQNEQSSLPYLGVYGNRMKAQASAMKVAEKLGLPIVPAPAPGKSPVLLG